MRYVILLCPSLLLSCSTPPEGVTGSPWAFTGDEDWKRVPLPGDRIERFRPTQCYANTYNREGISPEPAFSGAIYYNYGAYLRIARCDCVQGKVVAVEFVPWSYRTNRTREYIPVY